MSFTEFKETVQSALASGAVKLSPSGTDLTELDLAVQYAIGEEMTAQGKGPLTLTAEDIANLILKHCGQEVYNRVLAEEGNNE